jgi:hypothetical protein
MTGFDYGSEAEFFPSYSRPSRRHVHGYRRFARAADAIRFAIEDLSPEFLREACLAVDETRYDGGGIRRLYDSADFPLTRREGSRR